jgi:hypothetical protein
MTREKKAKADSLEKEIGQAVLQLRGLESIKKAPHEYGYIGVSNLHGSSVEIHGELAPVIYSMAESYWKMKLASLEKQFSEL